MSSCLDRIHGPALVSKMRGHGVETPVLVWSSGDAAKLEAILKVTGQLRLIALVKSYDVAQKVLTAIAPTDGSTRASPRPSAAARTQGGGRRRPERPAVGQTGLRV